MNDKDLRLYLLQLSCRTARSMSEAIIEAESAMDFVTHGAVGFSEEDRDLAYVKPAGNA